MVWWSEIQYALGDALGICRFAQKFNSIEHLGLEEFARLLYLATGMEFSEENLTEVGERIVTLERLFLQREGAGRSWDSLPERYFDEPMPSGAFKGQKLDRNQFDQMLNDYYDLHGWDHITGNPLPRSVAALGMEPVVRGEELL